MALSRLPSPLHHIASPSLKKEWNTKSDDISDSILWLIRGGKWTEWKRAWIHTYKHTKPFSTASYSGQSDPPIWRTRYYQLLPLLQLVHSESNQKWTYSLLVQCVQFQTQSSKIVISSSLISFREKSLKLQSHSGWERLYPCPAKPSYWLKLEKVSLSFCSAELWGPDRSIEEHIVLHHLTLL